MNYYTNVDIDEVLLKMDSNSRLSCFSIKSYFDHTVIVRNFVVLKIEGNWHWQFRLFMEVCTFQVLNWNKFDMDSQNCKCQVLNLNNFDMDILFLFLKCFEVYMLLDSWIIGFSNTTTKKQLQECNYS